MNFGEKKKGVNGKAKTMKKKNVVTTIQHEEFAVFKQAQDSPL